MIRLSEVWALLRTLLARYLRAEESLRQRIAVEWFLRRAPAFQGVATAIRVERERRYLEEERRGKGRLPRKCVLHPHRGWEIA